MKVTSSVNPSFNPVVLEITFETKDELDVFSKLSNYAPFIDAVTSMGGTFPSYEQMQKSGGNISCGKEFETAFMNTSYMKDKWRLK